MQDRWSCRRSTAVTLRFVAVLAVLWVGLKWCEHAGVARSAMGSFAGLRRDRVIPDELPINMVTSAPRLPTNRGKSGEAARQYRYRLEPRGLEPLPRARQVS
jgi:hypothetical protein